MRGLTTFSLQQLQLDMKLLWCTKEMTCLCLEAQPFEDDTTGCSDSNSKAEKVSAEMCPEFQKQTDR